MGSVACSLAQKTPWSLSPRPVFLGSDFWESRAGSLGTSESTPDG